MIAGLRIWGATGALELDENSFTVMVVYSAVIQSGGGQGRSIFIPITAVEPSTHSAVCVPITDYRTDGQSTAAIQYIPIVGAGGVTVFFGQPNTTGPIGILTPQRLLVMRNR